MNVIIVHYHLKVGGVTGVIESQCAALARGSASVKLFAGDDPHNTRIECNEITLFDKLNYLDPDVPEHDSKQMYKDIRSFFETHTDQEDILHVHNPNLGKNPVLTLVLHDMAADGFRVVSHCHDFAEDRPRLYGFMEHVIENIFGRVLEDVLYPGCFTFAVLNTSDLQRLVSYGVDSSQIHLLPNPVSGARHIPEQAEREGSRASVCRALDIDTEKKIFVYPVRAIKRKNIGEVILFSLLFRERAVFVITRSPKNPAEKELYSSWKSCAAEAEADIRFEAGETVDFNDIMCGCDRVITTSVREGFGMAFLEPWLYGMPVVGRDLPSVTGDFSRAGIVFKGLYSSLPVGDDTDTDFSALDPDEQMKYIEILGKEKERNRFLKRTGCEQDLFAEIPDSIIIDNADIIKDCYSVETYGKRLQAIYRQLSS